MIYLIGNFLSLTYFYIYSKFNYSIHNRIFLSIILIILMSLIPGLQYKVGTDYLSYENIFNSPSTLEYYFNIKEYLFYYLTKLIYNLELSSKAYFFIIAIIQSFLIFSLLTLSKTKNTSLPILFFCFFTITNLMHTQMNIIRVSFSFYLFSISLLLHLNRKNILSLIIFLLAFFFHKSSIIVFPLLLIPNKVYLFFYRHILFIYISTFILFLFNPFHNIVNAIIIDYFPHYSSYLEDGNFEKHSIVNILSKLYYIPIQLLFIYIVRNGKIIFSLIEKKMIGLWVIVSNSYLLILHFDFFARVNVFLIFFYIIPAIYLLFLYRKNTILFTLISAYLIFAYSLKVLFFPNAEFLYNTYLFN
ncbi:EpsG family protein [Proteus terrae]|uniref:EpsG family protein n=1 Tax=Proteus terrae TaxID=1574161 RepID=UPI001CBDF91B